MGGQRPGGRGLQRECNEGRGRDRGLGFLRLDVVILIRRLLASIPPVACGISVPSLPNTLSLCVSHTERQSGFLSGSPRTTRMGFRVGRNRRSEGGGHSPFRSLGLTVVWS